MSKTIIKHCVICGREFKIFWGSSSTRKVGLRPCKAKTCFRKECVKQYMIIGRRKYSLRPEVKARSNEMARKRRQEKRHTNLLND